MPSVPSDFDPLKSSREEHRLALESQIEGLPQMAKTAIAVRAAWRVIPWIFGEWSSEERLRDWWNKYGNELTSQLVLATISSIKNEGTRFNVQSDAANAVFSDSIVAGNATSAAALAVAHNAAVSTVLTAVNATNAVASAIAFASNANTIHFYDNELRKKFNFPESTASRQDIESAKIGDQQLLRSPLWPPSISGDFVEFWMSNVSEAKRRLGVPVPMLAWLMACTHGEPPLTEMKKWFNDWWLKHPNNKERTSAFSDLRPDHEPRLDHDFGEPFVLRRIYKDPIISNFLAGDGTAVKLTETAEKCKEALRAFVASQETEAPITVSVEAPWGAGKTSFLHHLRGALEEKNYIPTVWFNPWKHEAGKTLWAAFAVAYERQMAEKLSCLGLWRRRLMLSWLRLSAAEQVLLVFRLSMWLIGLGALGWLLCHGEDFAKDAESKVSSLLAKNLPVVGIPLLLWGFVKDLVGSFSSPLKIDMVSVFTRNQHEDGVDDLHRFHEDFERLMCAYTPGTGPLERFMTDLRCNTDPNWPDKWSAIARAVLLGVCRWVRRLLYTYSTPAPEKLSESPRTLWSRDRVVVFIDDLDRCEAPKAADVLQSLHLMLSGGGQERRKDSLKPPGVICILGMDREKVAAAVAAKHEKLLPLLLTPNEKDGKVAQQQALGFGHEFLEKFIQITLHLPGLTGTDQDQYLRMITGWKGEEKAATSTPEIAPGSAPSFAPFLGAQPAAETNSTPRPNEGRDASASVDEAERRKAEEIERTQIAVKEVETQLSDGQAAFLCASYVVEALERNPRRLKQFVNLLRLRLFLAAAMGLLDIASLDPQQKHRHLPGKLSVHDIAKLVALDLYCHQTMNDMREENVISLETLKERIKKEQQEPRLQAIEKMMESGINGDAESNSAYDLSKAPLGMYFQQLASVTKPSEIPAAHQS